MSCQIKSFPHSPYDIINKILSCKRITADHCSQFPNARIFFPFKNQPGAIHPSIISQRESSFCYSASHHSTVQRNLCKTAKIPLRIRNRGDVRQNPGASLHWRRQITDTTLFHCTLRKFIDLRKNFCVPEQHAFLSTFLSDTHSYKVLVK